MNYTLIKKCEEYIKCIREMRHCGARRLYELDGIRSVIHDEICKLLRLTKRTTQSVTDYLDEIDFNIKTMYIKLLMLKPAKGEREDMRYR